MSDTIKLRIAGRPTSEQPVEGWDCEAYDIAGTARAAGEEERHDLALPPDAVLELELENGTRLLVAAEEAGRYLARVPDRGGEGGVALEVGPVLRPSGPGAPERLARDGAFRWLLRSLRVFRQGPGAMTALTAAGTFQDALLGDRLGLYRLDPGPWTLSPVEELPPADAPALLFLHGTASSTEGSFRSLWQGESQTEALERIGKAYGNRVYGFEHRSLTESPVANALELVEKLPKGAKLHVVSHSRGGMVGELLARANRAGGGAAFTAEEIDRFLQHAGRTGRKGHGEDAERLGRLSGLLREKAIEVQRFVRVAAPVRGTTLASGRLDRWATVMLNLFGAGLNHVPGLQTLGPAYDLLKRFLLAVVHERTDARVLPGLEAMMPDSPLVALLNAPEVKVECPVYALAGDYQGDGLLTWIADGVSELFYGGATDLVVNTPSMSGGAARAAGIWLKPLAGPEVTHFTYFRRKESALPLLGALEGDTAGFERLPGPSEEPIARGGKKPMVRKDGPIALLLPGIMGSRLAVGRNRIWFDPIDLIGGGMEGLAIGAEVQPDGWMDRSYQAFAKHLSRTHEVRPFAYDWRLSIADEAKRFGGVLEQAMEDAKERGKPLHIVAHSMGGLVARLAMKDRWDAFKAIPGSRLVQFGTPNGGSHAIAAVLLGRDPFVQMIERWFDWRHDMKEFLDIVCRFPGVLELLPWPVPGGAAASDGVDYFDLTTWKDWWQQDAENQRGGEVTDPTYARARGAGDGWPLPFVNDLHKAKETVAEIAAAPLDPAFTYYVAGRDRTPVAVRLADGEVELGWTEQGDGRVPWATGIPGEAVRTWYVDAAHGDLLARRDAFDHYVKILETGDCGLPDERPGGRAPTPLDWSPVPLAVHALYPSDAEVLAAAVGGRPPRLGAAPAQRAEPTAIAIVHGSLACADLPVLIGAYLRDDLRGSAAFLDRHLGGRLDQAQRMGHYPEQPGEAMVFRQPQPGERPSGAVVVGLGPIGELVPGQLTTTLLHGLLEYARAWAEGEGHREPAPKRVELATLLVGTGYAGLGVELGMRCLVEAVYRANRALERGGTGIRYGTLRVYEEEESRVIAAARAVRDLLAEPKYADAVRFDGRIGRAEGAYRGLCADTVGGHGWARVHISSECDDNRLRFTLVTNRAMNAVEDEPQQKVDGLIRAATQSTDEFTCISRALFELLVPNGFKQALPNQRGLILALDKKAAAFPWELLREGDAARDEPPLATRIGVVRQLASDQGRSRALLVRDRGVLVVGDTQSGLAELPGARKEADAVARLFEREHYAPRWLDRPNAVQVYCELFDRGYRVIHIAAHGVVNDDDKGPTGVVLGDNSRLTPENIAKMSQVPELVFINCCHLGSMGPAARPRWDRLAANVGTAFIELGCKAVIAAGWAVDDAAAERFATTFYREMLGGTRFGEAVRRARAETYRHHPGSNTWGAYQAYGDQTYRLVSFGDDWQAPDFVHPGQVTAELDLLAARVGAADPDELKLYRERLDKIERAARPRFLEHAAVRERLADAWRDLGDKARAVEHYRAALEQPQGSISLRGLEQLANLEVRLGEERWDSDHGPTLADTGLKRVEALLGLLEPGRQHCLLGSAHKRRARMRLLRRKGKWNQALGKEVEKMLDAYQQAADASLTGTGERAYYPALNILDGEMVLLARGKDEYRADLKVRCDAWADAAIANGQRLYAEDQNFFHALSKADGMRVKAVWAALDDRPADAITHPDVRAALVTEYRNTLRRFGNARKHDSALYQIQWVSDFWPKDGQYAAVKAALRELKREIESASGFGTDQRGAT